MCGCLQRQVRTLKPINQLYVLGSTVEASKHTKLLLDHVLKLIIFALFSSLSVRTQQRLSAGTQESTFPTPSPFKKFASLCVLHEIAACVIGWWHIVIYRDCFTDASTACDTGLRIRARTVDRSVTVDQIHDRPLRIQTNNRNVGLITAMYESSWR